MPIRQLTGAPLDTKPFASLDESLDALVQCLNIAVPFRTWLVNRVNGDDACVLAVNDESGKVVAGAVMDWTGTYCKRMAEGSAPCYAEDAQSVAAYRAAGCNKDMRIGAYIGQPLLAEDGALLGTLCAIDPERRPVLGQDQRRLIAGVARTMSTLICYWMKVEQASQTERRLRYQAHTDALTGLANRHAWDLAILEEEAALARFGDNAMVVMIDLDGLKQINDLHGHAEGDLYLGNAAAVLREQIRPDDLAARIGGDEFGLLLHGVMKDDGALLRQRIVDALRDAGVAASVGHAMRLSHGTLALALREADAQMYEDKARRKRGLR